MVIPSILSRASLYFQPTPAAKQAPSSETSAGKSRSAEGVEVKVSPAAERLAKESRAVDHAKVDELRQRFSAGSYSVDHLGLARAMLASG